MASKPTHVEPGVRAPLPARFQAIQTCTAHNINSPNAAWTILLKRVDHLPPVASTSVDQVVRGFVPTRRFARVTFESYHPDPRFPSQAAARDRVRDFAAHTGQQRRAHLLHGLVRNTSAGRRAIYLDGGYGVGKTHLLAAAYHAVTDQRLYLSFGELAYTISRLGLEPTLAALAYHWPRSSQLRTDTVGTRRNIAVA
jgi:hypothetical protein